MLFGAGDVGVDGDPAALGQGGTFDRDGAAIGAGTFHIMGFKRAGLFHPFGHKMRHVVHVAVFTQLCQQRDRFLKARTGGDQRFGEVEHLLERCITQHQPQIRVIDRQRLRDQVQPRSGHEFCLVIVDLHAASPRGRLHHPHSAAKRNLGKSRLLQFVRIEKSLGKS